MQDPDKEGGPAQEDGVDTADGADSDIMGSDSEDGADTSGSCDTDADDGPPATPGHVKPKLELETGGGALITHLATVHRIVCETELEPKVVKNVLRALGNVVGAELRHGNNVKIHRLGTFTNVLRPKGPDLSAVPITPGERGSG